MQDGVSRLMEWVSNVRLGAKHGGQELCSQRLNWQDQVLEVLPWRFRSEQLTFPFIHSWQFVLGVCVSLARILSTLSDFQPSLGSCRPWFVSGAGDPGAMWEHNNPRSLQEISSARDTFCQCQLVSLERGTWVSLCFDRS